MKFTADAKFSYGNAEISLEEAVKAWTGTLEKVFKTDSGENDGATAYFTAAKDHEEGTVDENGLFHTNRVISAIIRLQSPVCLFRYSREQTASMTVPALLKEPEQRLT